MKKKLYVSFDTEMTNLDKNGDIISIGLCLGEREGRFAFYAEISDFDKSKMSEWVSENIINNLLLTSKEAGYYEEKNMGCWDDNSIIYIKDTFINVSRVLNTWLDKIMEYLSYEQIQFVSDVACYDFVHIVDLITNKGSAIDIRQDIAPNVIDINQLLDIPVIISRLGIVDQESFDINREELVERIKNDTITNKLKHNALFDASIISIIFEEISTILGIYQ